MAASLLAVLAAAGCAKSSSDAKPFNPNDYIPPTATAPKYPTPEPSASATASGRGGDVPSPAQKPTGQPNAAKFECTDATAIGTTKEGGNFVFEITTNDNSFGNIWALATLTFKRSGHEKFYAQKGTRVTVPRDAMEAAWADGDLGTYVYALRGTPPQESLKKEGYQPQLGTTIDQVVTGQLAVCDFFYRSDLKIRD